MFTHLVRRRLFITGNGASFGHTRSQIQLLGGGVGGGLHLKLLSRRKLNCIRMQESERGIATERPGGE